MDSSVFNPESQGCTNYMKTLYTCSSGIYYQHIVPSGITHHLEDVRMTAHEYVRAVMVYKLSSLRIISIRVTAHMGHQDLHGFTFEESVLRMLETKVMVITIACNTYQRLKFRYFRRQVHSTAEITGMPYLVYRLQKVAELTVEYTVSV